MRLYKLDKTVFSIKNNPTQFLNGLTSNDLDRPHNAFLSIHGRIVAVFDQIQITDDEYWIVLESSYAEAFLKHTEKYVMLSSVEVAKLNKLVFFDLDGSQGDTGSHVAIAQSQGQLIITDEALEPNVSDDEFTLFRVKNNIPVQGIDYTDDFALNVSEKDFISYSKGCFLGQEPVSKVHNRSRPSWQLVVEYEDQCDEETRAKMTSKILDPETQRIFGFVFIQNKQKA